MSSVKGCTKIGNSFAGRDCCLYVGGRYLADAPDESSKAALSLRPNVHHVCIASCTGGDYHYTYYCDGNGNCLPSHWLAYEDPRLRRYVYASDFDNCPECAALALMGTHVVCSELGIAGSLRPDVEDDAGLDDWSRSYCGRCVGWKYCVTCCVACRRRVGSESQKGIYWLFAPISSLQHRDRGYIFALRRRKILKYQCVKEPIVAGEWRRPPFNSR